MKKTVTMAIMCAAAFAASAQTDNTHSITLGLTTFTLLSEGQQQGSESILIDLPAEARERLIPDGTFPNATNVFLLRTEGKNILFDTGYGRMLPGNLAGYGLSYDEIDEIYLTHMHGDHIGGLMDGERLTFSNATVYVAAEELNYWTDRTIKESTPENRQGAFTAVEKIAEAYGDQLVGFTTSDGSVALQHGITAIPAYGHTPGHVAYRIEADDEPQNVILVWGDLTHAMAVQMPMPEVAVTYDVDPAEAVLSRRYILSAVADQDITIAGMHIAYPAMGRIESSPDGGYIFVPVE